MTTLCISCFAQIASYRKGVACEICLATRPHLRIAESAATKRIENTSPLASDGKNSPAQVDFERLNAGGDSSAKGSE